MTGDRPLYSYTADIGDGRGAQRFCCELRDDPHDTARAIFGDSPVLIVRAIKEDA